MKSLESIYPQRKEKPSEKNTRRTIHDEIETPKDLNKRNKKVEFSVDTITVNGMIFLTSISHDIFYRMAQYVPNKKPQNYEKCLRELIQL